MGTLSATRLPAVGRAHKGPGCPPVHDPPYGGPSGAGRGLGLAGPVPQLVRQARAPGGGVAVRALDRLIAVCRRLHQDALHVHIRPNDDTMPHGRSSYRTVNETTTNATRFLPPIPVRGNRPFSFRQHGNSSSSASSMAQARCLGGTHQPAHWADEIVLLSQSFNCETTETRGTTVRTHTPAAPAPEDRRRADTLPACSRHGPSAASGQWGGLTAPTWARRRQ